jgi:hypothetical protein
MIRESELQNEDISTPINGKRIRQPRHSLRVGRLAYVCSMQSLKKLQRRRMSETKILQVAGFQECLDQSTWFAAMLYTPREIAEDLDVPETTLRDWLNHGAPHSRDESNHIGSTQAFAAGLKVNGTLKRNQLIRFKRGGLLYALQCHR